MPLQKAAQAIKRKIEDGQQEQLQQGIPADRLKNQAPGSALPPGGPSGNGYPPAPHDTDWADVTGTPTTLGGYGITDAASDTELAGEASTRAAADTALAAPQYITLALSGTLPNERRLVAGANITLTDGGANGDLEIAASGGGGGSALTVEEVDGSPTDSAITKIKFPNGTLAIAAHEATYTPAGGGGGNATSTGAAGSEPGGPASGDLYLPNNGYVVERYSGSAWTPWGPIFAFTEPPAAASWTWDNQSTATFADEGRSRYMAATNASDNNVIVVGVSAPYTITACYLWNPDITNGVSDGGLCFRESGSGKLITIGHEAFSGTISEMIRKWNSTSSHSADYINFSIGNARVRAMPYWVRLKDDNTNRMIQYSVDGQHWITRHSVGRTDFLTADQAGLYMRSASGGTSQITLLSWG